MNFKISVPQFKTIKYNIIEYGAVSGGVISCTKAIQKAIDECYENGGGHVIIPSGMWLSGPLMIKDNVDLHIMRSGLLVFSKNMEDYPLIISDYEGEKRIRTVSPISAKNAKNIGITGQGVIDGSGHLWRPIKQFKLTPKFWKRKIESNDCIIQTEEGGIWYPTKSAYEGCLKGEIAADVPNALELASPNYDLYRPVMVSLVGCDQVLIEGVTIQNSPAWNVHPLYCTNLTIKDCQIRNHYCAQNGDGLDLESCQYCEIYNTTFDVGDDAICLKSGKGRVARETKIPTKFIHIHDCVVYEAHGGFVIGSETSRGLSDILVEDCTFIGTDIGIRFKSALGRGGVVERITLRNINMLDIKEEAIIFTMGYQLFTLTHETPDISLSTNEEDIPVIKNIMLDNITCSGAKIALSINGLEQQPIQDITLSNSNLVANRGFSIERAKNIKLINTRISNKQDMQMSFIHENLDSSHVSKF